MKEAIFVPPLKIQGIKTKLVPVIKNNVIVDEDCYWIEPFMGSGVVGFNVAPYNAIFADTNPYIIAFYNAIKSGEINAYIVRRFLEDEGKKLLERDEEYYYEVRDRFNRNQNSLDFLFLNRSCFNGMIRFNKSGDFNVPYGHKPNRFAKAYITKIVNQVAHVEKLIRRNNWSFVCQTFEKTIQEVPEKSFIYCDPPYIGRHVDYYDSWDEECEFALKNTLIESQKPFMLSTWDYNSYRKNEYIDTVWGFCEKINISHFYHVGAKEENRNPIMEALLINYPRSTGDEASFFAHSRQPMQISIFDIKMIS